MSDNATGKLVSVIIPTYGRPDLLSRTIDSVLSQTYKNIEIIVVDDNDPDTDARALTSALMESYSADSRVRYLKHEKNKNGSAARNTGIRAAAGEYLTFIDDDDVMLPERIYACVSCLSSLSDDYGLCYTRYRINKPGGVVEISSESRCGDCYLCALMRTFFICGGSNVFIKKSVALEIGGFDESFLRNQDIEFVARACERYKIAFIDKVLLEIYQEGKRGSRTFEEINSTALHYLEKFDSRIKALPERDRERVISVISLERCRVAFVKKRRKEGLAILRENRVPVIYRLRYMRYLIKRVITKKSFGFDGS